MKVNVWQVGFATYNDYVLRDNRKAACRPMGYVELEECELWQEEVWHLLNWSCWTSKKPKGVHSPLDHCNSDVILQVVGTGVYLRARFVGWGKHISLKYAVRAMKRDCGEFWPFHDVQKVSGHTKSEDGKAYYRANGEEEWKEITW